MVHIESSHCVWHQYVCLRSVWSDFFILSLSSTVFGYMAVLVVVDFCICVALSLVVATAFESWFQGDYILQFSCQVHRSRYIIYLFNLRFDSEPDSRYYHFADFQSYEQWQNYPRYSISMSNVFVATVGSHARFYHIGNSVQKPYGHINPAFKHQLARVENIDLKSTMLAHT